MLNRFGKGPVKSDRQVDERPRVPWTSATLPAEKLAEYGQRFTAGVIKCALIEDKYEKKDAEKRAKVCHSCTAGGQSLMCATKDLLEHLVPCPPLFGALGYETIMAARKRSADVKQKKALRACELDVLPEVSYRTSTLPTRLTCDGNNRKLWWTNTSRKRLNCSPGRKLWRSKKRCAYRYECFPYHPPTALIYSDVLDHFV